MYENIFNNDKIRYGSKILIVSRDYCIDSIKNIHIVKELKISLMNITYDHNLPVIDVKFDIIIFIKLITSFETNIAYEYINNYKEYLSEDGKVFFIDDYVLYQNQINNNPINYLKNLLYNTISKYNLGKTIAISDAYDLFHQFNMNVIDCDRIYSEYYYNLYPIEYYSFICKFKKIF